MAFQPRPLHIPGLTTNYSAENSAFSNLGQTLGNLPSEFRKEQLNAQKQQLLGQLANGKADYNKVGLGLVALGDTQAGASLLALGQKQQQLDDQKGIANIFSGGGAPLGSTAPTAGPASLIQNESGGNWQAQNNAVGSGGAVGHFGRLQFGQARIQDAINAGALPPGTTPQAFMASPDLQKRAEAWHFSDIDQKIQQNGFDKLIGQSINGVPITVDGLRAVAHLGGTEGMRKFVESGGRYNPADENGTRLSDYFARHGGAGTGRPTQVAPVQVAENEADVARFEAQMPGYGGAQPAQVAQAPVAGDNVAKLRADAQYYAQSNPEAARQFNARADALERGNGGQVAQAPGSADLPPQGANAAPTQAQGFAVPGNTLPPNDPYPRVTTQQLYGVLQNPAASDGQRAMAKSIIDNRMKYSDENAPDKREMTRLQTEKLRREVEGEGARPMTPKERADYNVAPNQPAFITRTGDPKFGPVGTSITNSVDTKGETEEAKAIGQSAGKRAGEMMASAASGTKQLQRIGQLEALLKNVESGRLQPGRMSMAALGKSLGVNEDFLRGIGLDPAKVGDAQAINAITGRMVVDMIGSGGFPANNFSDADRAFITGTVPSLANDPRGNKIVMEAARRTAQIDIEKAKAWRDWRKDNKGGSFDDFEVQWGDKLASQDRFSDLAKQAEVITGPQPAASTGWQDLGGGIRIREKR